MSDATIPDEPIPGAQGARGIRVLHLYDASPGSMCPPRAPA